MKDKKYLLFVLLLIPIVMIFVSNSFSIPYTGEIKSVEIQSNDYNAPGSWHIDKSAEWVEFGKARVTFDVNSVMKTAEGRYKDVIFVMDISGSMRGDKLDRAKQDAIDLTNYLLSDSHNSIALITFDTTSEVISGFINDKDQMVNYITNLNDKGCTNYNAGLLNADIVMENYVKEDNKDLVLLFLTDGYPNVDTPNQIATYQLLKSKYPYMTINGIQYEMGKDIIQEIVGISDYQFIADQDTLNNVLFDAAVTPFTYDNFVITDYINNDYFYVESVNDINVPFGEVSLNTENGVQKITWNLGNNYITGRNVKMLINLKLKEVFHNTRGFYPTNKSETIVSKLPDEQEKTRESELTPVLKNVYEVIYDTNTPDGCTLPSIENEEYMSYQTVTKRSDSLACPRYLFKGWDIDSNDSIDIKFINDDMFVMPTHDVHIRATWTKQDTLKSMDGTIHEKLTLYRVLEGEANIGTYAKEYTGPHQDSYNNVGTSNIYYYYASNNETATTILDKNNVIFANHCWQMLRTTDTGGVKLIYNGEVEDGKCLASRGTHIGYASNTTQTLATNYYYGTDYTYDSVSKKFGLSGSVSTGEIKIGEFTCRSTSGNSTCTTLYYVNSLDNNLNYNVLSISSNSNYAQFGSLQFNTKFNLPEDVGYMYNTRYTYGSIGSYKETMLSHSWIYAGWWYSDSVTWGSPVENRYNLDNPYQVPNSADYPNLVGKYSFNTSSETISSSSVNYIAGIRNDGLMYYIKLSDSPNHNLSDYNDIYIYGDSYIENGDGTYTINDYQTIERKDWYRDRSNVKENKYICKNAVNGICNELWYTTYISDSEMSYIKVNDMNTYSKSFTWDGSKYILDDDTKVSFWNFKDMANKELLYNAHYTCWNNNGECEKISYVFYSFFGGASLSYIVLENGEDVETALNKMLYNEDVNTYDSVVKTGIDLWYKRYMLDYDEYIEDTIYCNDRSQKNGETNGWNPDGGRIIDYMDFKSHYSLSTLVNLSCTNETDKFSTLNNKAKLTYKVGLATSPELQIIGNALLRKTGQYYWHLTPIYFGSIGYAIGYYVAPSGSLNSDYGNPDVYKYLGVRPTISLIPGIEYSSGDGSMENPYIIDTSSND